MKKGFVLILIALLILVLGITSYILYIKYISNNQVSGTRFVNPKIIYTRQTTDPNNRYSFSKSEVWMMDSDGKNQQNLNLGEDIMAINNTTTSWIYYFSLKQSPNTPNEEDIYAYNYLTKQTKIIREPNYTGKPNTLVQTSDYQVSPDDKKILYSVLYFYNGFDPITKEMGHEYDLYPDHKTGYYVYNIETDKKVYIGPAGGMWNSDSLNISVPGHNNIDAIYHEYKLDKGYDYQINTDTGKVSVLSKIPSTIDTNGFYYVYPVNPNLKVISEDVQAIVIDSLKVVAKNKETIIDTNVCNYISCLRISPDSRYAIYTKGSENSILDRSDSVALLDLNSLKTKVVLKPEYNESYWGPVWVTPTAFMAELDTGNPTATQSHDIILYNISNNTSTPLTTTADAIIR